MKSDWNGHVKSFLLFTAKWCAAAEDLVDNAEKLLPQFLPDVDIEIVYDEKDHARYAVRVLPTIVKLEDELEVARIAGTSIDLIRMMEFMR